MPASRTRRETRRRKAQIQNMWGRGMTARRIAEELNISTSSVYYHIGRSRARLEEVNDPAVQAGLATRYNPENRVPSEHQAQFFPRLDRALGYFTHKDRTPEELATATMSLRAINSMLSQHVKAAKEALASQYAADEPLVFAVDAGEDGSAADDAAWVLSTNTEATDYPAIEDDLWDGIIRRCEANGQTSPQDVLAEFRKYSGAVYRDSALLDEFGQVSGFYKENIEQDAPGLRPLFEDDFETRPEGDDKLAQETWEKCFAHADDVLGLSVGRSRGIAAALNPKRARRQRLRQMSRLLSDAEMVRNATAAVESRLADGLEPGDTVFGENGAALFKATSNVKRRGPKHQEFDAEVVRKLAPDTPPAVTLAAIRRIVSPRWKKDAAMDLANQEIPRKTTYNARRSKPEESANEYV